MKPWQLGRFGENDDQPSIRDQLQEPTTLDVEGVDAPSHEEIFPVDALAPQKLQQQFVCGEGLKMVSHGSLPDGGTHDGGREVAQVSDFGPCGRSSENSTSIPK